MRLLRETVRRCIDDLVELCSKNWHVNMQEPEKGEMSTQLRRN